MGSFSVPHLFSLMLVTEFHFPLGNCPSPNVGLPSRGQHFTHFKARHVAQDDPPMNHCPLGQMTGPNAGDMIPFNDQNTLYSFRDVNATAGQKNY